MGDKNVQGKYNENELRSFNRAVLSDLRGLDEMLKSRQIESGVRRIGAEQSRAGNVSYRFSSPSVSRMESELVDILRIAKRTAAAFGADVVLAGILPTIHRSDLTLKNLTRSPRYEEINRVVSELYGRDRQINIKYRRNC